MMITTQKLSCVISWFAAEIIGPPNVYPNYGDKQGTWAADCCDRQIEYITVLQYLVFFLSFPTQNGMDNYI
jgi:hypothetical protein